MKPATARGLTQDELEELERQKRKEEEDRELEKLLLGGTAVTRENFLEWKAKFDEELAQKRDTVMKQKEKDAEHDAMKLTGREYFDMKAAEGEAALLESFHQLTADE